MFHKKKVIIFLSNINCLASLRGTPLFAVMREITSYTQPKLIFTHAAKFRVRSLTGPSEIFCADQVREKQFFFRVFMFIPRLSYSATDTGLSSS